MTYMLEGLEDLRDLHELSDILEAEAAGHPINPGRGAELAHLLSHLHPSISSTLRLIAERMEGALAYAA